MANSETEPTNVSVGQRTTRRRALGRRLIRKASDVSVLCGDLNSDPDLKFLSERERIALDKALANLRKVAAYIDKLGTSMDKDS